MSKIELPKKDIFYAKAYNKLSPKNQVIIKQLEENFSQREVASKHGITEIRVAQIKKEFIRMVERERLVFAEFENDHIINLELCGRTYNSLIRAGVITIDQLVETITDLDKVSKIRNLGNFGYNEIVDKLNSLGYNIEKRENREIKKFFVMFSPSRADRMNIVLFVKAYELENAKRIALEYAQNNKNLKSMIMSVLPVEIKEEMFITENDIKEIKGEK